MQQRQCCGVKRTFILAKPLEQKSCKKKGNKGNTLIASCIPIHRWIHKTTMTCVRGLHGAGGLELLFSAPWEGSAKQSRLLVQLGGGVPVLADNRPPESASKAVDSGQANQTPNLTLQAAGRCYAQPEVPNDQKWLQAAEKCLKHMALLWRPVSYYLAFSCTFANVQTINSFGVRVEFLNW